MQFTRNPAGLTGALRKIGGLSLGSTLQAAHSEQLGHFFFAQGFETMFDSIWATHPALEERIRALDPRWDGKFADTPPLVSVRPAPASAQAETAAAPPIPPPLAPAAIIASIGTVFSPWYAWSRRWGARKSLAVRFCTAPQKLFWNILV